MGVLTGKSGREKPDIIPCGTGNYNGKTARMYKDLSLMTAAPTIGLEAAAVLFPMSDVTTARETADVRGPEGTTFRFYTGFTVPR